MSTNTGRTTRSTTLSREKKARTLEIPKEYLPTVNIDNPASFKFPTEKFTFGPLENYKENTLIDTTASSSTSTVPIKVKETQVIPENEPTTDAGIAALKRIRSNGSSDNEDNDDLDHRYVANTTNTNTTKKDKQKQSENTS